MQPSFMYSIIRAFFVAFFAMVGVCFGLILLFILIAALSSSSTTELDTNYSKEIVANADGERKVLSTNSPVILKLNISGVIGSDSLSAHTINRQLIESREGDLTGNRIKAILLYINSPGGTVIDADGIYHAIKAYKEKYKIPVYAYVDGLCASGGMYVACATDKIYASDVSLIGSVGVLLPTFLNFTGLMEKVGVQSLSITAGKDKDELNPLRPWKPNEGTNIQALVNHYYQEFVEIVTKNRPEMNKEKLINDYGAKLFSAAQAKEYGYITAAGETYNSTLKLLLKEIGIEDNYYQVIELKQMWYTSLFSGENTLMTGKITHQLQVPSQLDAKLMNQFLYLYSPEQ